MRKLIDSSDLQKPNTAGRPLKKRTRKLRVRQVLTVSDEGGSILQLLKELKRCKDMSDENELKFRNRFESSCEELKLKQADRELVTEFFNSAINGAFKRTYSHSQNESDFSVDSVKPKSRVGKSKRKKRKGARVKSERAQREKVAKKLYRESDSYHRGSKRTQVEVIHQLSDFDRINYVEVQGGAPGLGKHK